MAAQILRKLPISWATFSKTWGYERVKKLAPAGGWLLFVPLASNLRESSAASDFRARVRITLSASRRSGFGVQRASQGESTR
jgi:hypothetical protein